MTNETKIGLLVGLAFIIVIGILLADFGRNQEQPAALMGVGDNLRAGAATPHNGSTQNEIVPPPAVSAPARTVLTRDELHEEPRITISPGGTQPMPPVRDHPAIRPVNPDNSTAFIPGTVPIDVKTSGPADTNEGATTDTDHPMPTATNPPIVPVPTTPAPNTVNGARQYVVVAGDTVSKLAGRFMGGNTKTNREAIIALNASLKQNPNNLIVGRTYLIPPAGKAVAAAPPAHPPEAKPAPVPAGPQYFYTVKENDSLWKIASEQLGDGNAWAAIKDLNKDLLKGGDSVRPNMRLRLPAKPVATTE